MKAGSLKKFDAAEHLTTPEACREYLSIVFSEGDPVEIHDALNIVARAHGMVKVTRAAK